MSAGLVQSRAAILAVGVFSACSGFADAQTTFDFESVDQLDSPLVTGAKANYIENAEQAVSGTQSIRFDYSAPDAYQSWTYDMPFALSDGTISVWFHDSIGPDSTLTKFGGSIILEEIANPGNFLAVEIWNGPYPASGDPSPGAPNYYLTRGFSSAPTTFKSRYFGDRSIGWHQVVFNITGSGSTASVDGISNAEGAAMTFGPGSSAGLRLRFMAWSASDGGFSNWTTDTEPSTGISISDPYIHYDDLTITATAPAANTRTEGFEIESGTATYDAPTEFMGPTGFDNVFMKNLVPQWNPETNPALVHSGSQSISFTNEDPVLKSIAFDLSTAHAGTITLKMFDALGADVGFDKVGGSIIIEQASDPSNFLALEVWNGPYPPSGDPTPGAPNYYLTKGSIGSPATAFSSRYFGNRQTGWRDIAINLTATSSSIMVDGIENSNGTGMITGPGLSDGIRLRLMADSPSCGGFTNYLDPSTSELNYLYLTKTATYLYFDDIVLPIGGASDAGNWQAYE